MRQRSDCPSVDDARIDRVLAKLHQRITQATSFEDIKCLRDRVLTVREFARQLDTGLATRNRIVEARLRAERRAGRMIARMHLRGGDRRSPDREHALSLNDLGISQDQSKRWQRLARMDEHLFEQALYEIAIAGKELSTARMLSWLPTAMSGATVPKPHTARRARPDTTSDPSELVYEAIEHYQMIASILSSAPGDARPLHAAERKHLSYLLAEVDQAHEQLKQLLIDFDG